MSVTPFASAVRNHVGRVRQRNEDSFCVRPDIGLWAVADGMGGHADGQRASGAIRAALQALAPDASSERVFEAVEQALLATHADLTAGSDGHIICGSTVAVLLLADGHAAILWAGDSRIYRLRGGRLEQLTRDHSRVQEMVDRGELTPEAARISPLRNRITRALGVPGPLDLEARQLPSEASDLYLLCSDGLTGELNDSEIAAILEMDSLEAAADVLLARALAAGGRDNITFILVTDRVLDDDATLPKRR
jgi:serine/threonine protein phosphatase PrpC